MFSSYLLYVYSQSNLGSPHFDRPYERRLARHLRHIGARRALHYLVILSFRSTLLVHTIHLSFFHPQAPVDDSQSIGR